jgi:hypothetical protein
MKKQETKIRKNYGNSSFDEFFDTDELIRVAELAETAIIKWPLELSDELDMPIDELAGMRVKLKEFLDEEVF